MSNNLTSFFTRNNNNISIINMQNGGSKLSQNENILKLPKITINNPINHLITENNKSSKELNNPNGIGHFFRISKINSYNKKTIPNKKISNNFVRNKIFSEINHSSKKSFNKSKRKYIKKFSELNDSKKEKISNNNSINSNIDNISTGRNVKENIKINEYINVLLNEDKDKINSLKNKKEDKYTLEKSIDPVKYIKNMFLDESYNNDIFKTSKIQSECFNGNEELRNDNIKKINANNMNNLNLKSIKLESNNDKTKILINEMYKDQNLNNFYFGKKLYKSKFKKISNHINIKNYLKFRKRENNNNNLSLNDKIKSVLTETYKMRNNFINKHKSRDKILRRLHQYCDNYDGIVRRASILKVHK